LSPLLHGSLPTKTSFGPDGKKQLSKPTNDLKKLFHGSPPETLKLTAATCSEPAAERSNGTKLFATSVTRWPAWTVTATPLVAVEAGAAVVVVSL
jgi:hypothetical protein